MIRNFRIVGDKMNPIKNLKITYGYAHYEFSGEITDEYISMIGRMPTAEEIIRLVDGTNSNFGAKCYIYDKKFNGRIDTD